MKTSCLRPLTESDIEELAAHMDRHHAESGVDGAPLFSPLDNFDAGRFLDNRREAWGRALGTENWERWWVLPCDEEIVGHVDLSHTGLPQCHHRTRLGIGLEGAHRGAGHGRRLMSAALDWARAQPELDWVELGVFADNLPAQKLYEDLGFQVTGRTDDLFRRRGVSIDDIQMSLRLR